MIPNFLNPAQKSAIEDQLNALDAKMLELHLLLQNVEVGSGDGEFLTSITEMRGLAQNVDHHFFSLMLIIAKYWDHNRGPYTSIPKPPPSIEDLTI